MNFMTKTFTLSEEATYKSVPSVCSCCGKTIRIEKALIDREPIRKKYKLCFNCFKQKLNSSLPPLSSNKFITGKVC